MDGIASDMAWRFVKMHGLGNDFMLVEWPADRPTPEPALVRRWSDRRLGVGFDSLLLVDRDADAGVAARYRVINADGGEAEQCGNGARCIASFLAGRPGAELVLASAGGPVTAKVLDAGRVSIDLGVPDFRPAAVPFRADAEADTYTRSVDSGDVTFGVVSMGNPHAVIEVDSVETAAVGILGVELGRHPDFPEGANVGFMEHVDAQTLRLRVYERGIGETLACGTGAAAAVAIARRRGRVDEHVDVRLPGGVLTVSWPGPGASLWQTGQTTKVYEGLIDT